MCYKLCVLPTSTHIHILNIYNKQIRSAAAAASSYEAFGYGGQLCSAAAPPLLFLRHLTPHHHHFYYRHEFSCNRIAGTDAPSLSIDGSPSLHLDLGFSSMYCWSASAHHAHYEGIKQYLTDPAGHAFFSLFFFFSYEHASLMKLQFFCIELRSFSRTLKSPGKTAGSHPKRLNIQVCSV